MRRAWFALLLLVSPATYAGEFDALFQKHGAAHGVDWRLLKAIAQVESHLNPGAENPDGLSSGLMQIYCAPAHAGVCRNRFNIVGWPPASRAQLYDPDYNISIGAQILAWNLRHLGFKRGIAAYNQWNARRTPKGKPFPNQFYVDRVLRRYREIERENQSLALALGCGPAAELEVITRHGVGVVKCKTATPARCSGD